MWRLPKGFICLRMFCKKSNIVLQELGKGPFWSTHPYPQREHILHNLSQQLPREHLYFPNRFLGSRMKTLQHLYTFNEWMLCYSLIKDPWSQLGVVKTSPVTLLKALAEVLSSLQFTNQLAFSDTMCWKSRGLGNFITRDFKGL